MVNHIENSNIVSLMDKWVNGCNSASNGSDVVSSTSSLVEQLDAERKRRMSQKKF